MRIRISLLLLIFTTTLTSCFTTRNNTGFGGRFDRHPQSSISTANSGSNLKNVALSLEMSNEPNVPQNNETHELQTINLAVSALQKKVIVGGSIKSKLGAFTIKPAENSVSKVKSDRKKLVQKIKSMLPDSRSRWDYWLLFVILAATLPLAISFIYYISISTSSFELSIMTVGLIYSIIQALVTLAAIKSYKRMLQCGFLFGFGLWASVIFWWFFFIPLALWLIISLFC